MTVHMLEVYLRMICKLFKTSITRRKLLINQTVALAYKGRKQYLRNQAFYHSFPSKTFKFIRISTFINQYQEAQTDEATTLYKATKEGSTQNLNSEVKKTSKCHSIK